MLTAAPVVMLFVHCIC